MRNRKKLIYFTAVYIISGFINSEKVDAYPWPVHPCSQAHMITGSLGEYRAGPPVHFHKGVDIGEGAYTPVYPVSPGHVDEIGRNYVKVGNFVYRHIKPEVQVSDNVIECGSPSETILGKINPAGSDLEARGYHPHLHLEENNGGANPLRPDGLIPYNDNASPECIQNSVRIWRETGINTPDDQNPQITNGILSGVIDISARMKDFYTDTNGSSGGGRTGIYEDGGTDKGEIFAPEFSLSYNIKNGGVR